ncbi:MAG: enoyl-CoA hydratase [Gammaproteobacteria bacterium]|nr:enoyl-CoA hydratase [Gammaproteobacteria bacterium]|tara:strand:- start:346 stop:1170 length:825 start_codon:yes stop_codon:yes gene_type:complete
MSYETLLYEVSEHVATITFNRPEKMNTWNAQVASELSEAMLKANTDDEVRAIVLTGAGRAFCAGADLERGGDTFANRDESGGRQSDEGRNTRNVYPNEIDKPVIAAINGAAVGVGMTYPMLCDIRLASEGAKMGFVFTRRGMMPELAAHLIVQRVAGLSNAADILLSGRIFTSEEALEMGIVSKVFPKDQLLDAAHEMAKDYANTAPASVAITKHLLWQGLDSSPKKMMEAEGPSFAWLGNQPDAKEGIMSFLEKRAPAWELSAQDVPDEFKNG